MTRRLRALFIQLLLVGTLFPAIFALQEGEEPSTEAQKEEKKTEEKEAPVIYQVPLPGLKFRAIGPALTSGRVADFAVNPANPSEYYVAVASGGVWKTTNKGITFKPVFDSQGSYSIGCVTMDPNNHNVVWVGTGENNNQRSVAYGDGVYRTVDGGKNWRNMGLKQSEHIGMIAIDPRDSEVVYVAAYGPLWSSGGDRGLYKTVDGGENWEAVLTISEHTGVSEVHLDPRDPDVIYAVAHQRRRHVFTMISGGPESALYKSTDGGKNWRKLTRGLPSGQVGRIGIALSHPNPDVIYAIVEAQEEKGGFYRSTDRGESWERRSGYTTSGNYYQELFADPVDVDRVYALDVYNQVTTDGGKTWSRAGESDKHVDNHALWIDPSNPNYLLAGCDGGIYESYDRGETWRYMPNLSVTQFYKVSVDNAEPFYNVYGGTQDNYSLGGPSRTRSSSGITNEDWFVTQGGDGFETQVDPQNPNIIYAQSQYGNLVRYDRLSGERVRIQPQEGAGENSYTWNWDAPLLISSHSPTRLYFASEFVFRSDDRGDSWVKVSLDLSRQIDRNQLEVMGRVWGMDAIAKHDSTTVFGNIVSLDESPLAEGLLIAGSDDGLIHITEDGGGTWVKYDGFPDVPEWTYVNELVASQHDRNTIFAAFNNHKRGDFKPYLLRSRDLGKTWTSIASNLPERGSVYAIAEDHVNPNLLFVGTEFGVFFSATGGDYWKKLPAGLPTIAVRDIEIQKRENDLVLATFGRGFYVLDNYAPLRDLTDGLVENEAQIFPVSDGWMFQTDSRVGGRGRGYQGASFFAEDNPDVGAKLTFFYRENDKSLKEIREEKEKELFKKGEPIPYPSYEELRAEEDEEKTFLLFHIHDSDNRLVRVLRAPAKKGIHRVNWDLRFPRATSASTSDADPSKDAGSGISVVPGTYTVSMSRSVNGVITRLADPVTFEVRLLGERSIPVRDWDELSDFQAQLSELSRALNGTQGAVRQIDEQLKYYRSALKALNDTPSEILSQIQAVEKRLDEIRRKLSGDRTRSRLDMDSEPSISNRVNSVVFASLRSMSSPSEAQRKVYAVVEQEFDPLIREVNQILIEELSSIETKLDAAGAPWTPGRKVDWRR